MSLSPETNNINKILNYGRFILKNHLNPSKLTDIDSTIGLAFTIARNNYTSKPHLQRYTFSTIFANTLRLLWKQEYRKSQALFRSLFNTSELSYAKNVSSLENIELECILYIIIFEVFINMKPKNIHIVQLYIDGYSMSEIADIHKISRTRVFTIIKDFRKVFYEKWVDK